LTEDIELTNLISQPVSHVE